MQILKTILIITFTLGLAACASDAEKMQDVYSGQTLGTIPAADLPSDLNKSNIGDYYRVPDVVHENYQSKNTNPDIKPPGF